MATFNTNEPFLAPPVVNGRGSQGFRLNQVKKKIHFSSPQIETTGSVALTGSANENVSGWELGMIQLEYIETNYATYRGRTSRDGGAKLSWNSNRRIYRDKEPNAPGVWYDAHIYKPVPQRGVSRPMALDARGRCSLQTGFVDEPEQEVVWKITNARTGQINFLHHADIAFHFCAMMVVKNPVGQFTVLKHFYWNVRWEAHFRPNPAGEPEMIGRADHFDFNVQRHVQSGMPNDARFRNRVFDLSLPIANIEADRPGRSQFSADWSIT